MAELGLHHDGGQHQGRRVGQERHPQSEAGEHPADDGAADVADQEGGGIGPGDPAAAFRRREPDHERHGRHREHHRTSPAEAAEDQQLPVILGESTGGRGRRDDQQPGHIDRTFAQLHDQGTAGRCEDEPHESEDAHNHRRRGRPDVERGGELGQNRCHEAEADRNQEGRHQHHLDVPGQPGTARSPGRDLGCGVAGGAGGLAHNAFVLGKMRCRLAAGPTSAGIIR